MGRHENEEIGEHINEIRVEMDVDPRSVTIFECRPPWHEDFGPEWTRQEDDAAPPHEVDGRLDSLLARSPQPVTTTTA